MQKTQTELNSKTVKKLVDCTGDLRLSDGTVHRGARISEVRTSVTLVIFETARGTLPVPIDGIKEFVEYGRKWQGQKTDIDNKMEDKQEENPEE